MTQQQIGSTRWRWNSRPPSTHPADFPVVLLTPPYGPTDMRAVMSDQGSVNLPGAVLAVEVLQSRFELDPLRARIRQLSAHISTCPVVVLLRIPPEEGGLLAAARLAPHGLRAVVPHGPGMGSALREALTDPVALPQSVVAWLRLRSVRLNPNLSDLIERLVRAAPEYPDASRLLEACRIPQGTARWRLRKRGLPPPSRWFQGARALHAALRLQAQPEASTMEIARQIGFADHSALVHLFRRSFGTGATEVRRTLGWEWLLDRWFNSHAGWNVSRRRRPARPSARV